MTAKEFAEYFVKRCKEAGIKGFIEKQSIFPNAIRFRFEDDSYEYCPLTFAAKMDFGVDHSNGNFHYAGLKYNLDEQSGQIALAADGESYADPEIRKILEQTL